MQPECSGVFSYFCWISKLLLTAPKPHAHDYLFKKLNACEAVQNAVECIAMHPECRLNAAVFSNIFWIAKLLVTAAFLFGISKLLLTAIISSG